MAQPLPQRSQSCFEILESAALGLKNRELVVAAFSQERMFAAYSEIFAS